MASAESERHFACTARRAKTRRSVSRLPAYNESLQFERDPVMSHDSDRRNLVASALFATILNSLPGDAAVAAAHSKEKTPMSTDPLHDFDLFFGSWQTQHRRLKERLANSNEWIEFDGTSRMEPLLGGYGNMDDNVFNMPGGTYRGVSMRAFDPKTRTWAIWWLDERFPHTIDVPVIGSFKDGIGTFYADETFKGKPIKVRFLWSGITRTARQWEQAFSPDGGATWETNWVTRFTRTA